MRIASFNAQNLRLRRWASGPHLDGARDDIVSHELSPEEKAADAKDRELTARLIAKADADVVALQEVFDAESLDYFHDTRLAPLGALYPHRVCIPGNDGRRHVAFMSRLPLADIESNARLTFGDIGAAPPEETAPFERVLRRDCLAARCGELWLFNCHFKASGPGDDAGRAVRRAEALAVRRVIERRFANPSAALWLALGDFNAHSPENEEDLAPLAEGFAIDLALRSPEAERWTYYQPDAALYSCPDRILASPALAAKHPDARLTIMRDGLGRAASAYTGLRFPEVGERRPRASDHALVLLDLPS